jgi:spore coat protein A
LSYPVSGDPESPWVPEVYGNFILANGKLFPYLDVEACKYRFRIMNGSNARFYHLVFGDDFEIHQIGGDQGLLSAPVPLNGVALAPGERVDIVFDFSAYAGQHILLSSAGSTIMQFRVGSNSVKDEGALAQRLRPICRIPENHAVRTRLLTLDEKMTPMAKADPFLRPDDSLRSMGMLLNGTPWHMPVTEKPLVNTTEIWELVNLTQDTHPIHLHLVRFQLLGRRSFDVAYFNKTRELRFLAPAIDASPSEAGWKDTIRADPGMVTRIIVPFDGFAGRYVWHCHILEHEDNDMMRPYEIVAVASD